MPGALDLDRSESNYVTLCTYCHKIIGISKEPISVEVCLECFTNSWTTNLRAPRPMTDVEYPYEHCGDRVNIDPAVLAVMSVNELVEGKRD